MKGKSILKILFVISIIFNIFLFINQYNKQGEKKVSNQTEKYHLIDPQAAIAIDSNIQNQSKIIHYVELKPQIEDEIKKFNAEEKAGFFLQDIQTGSWLGINERTGYVPASLLKVPIMISILKKVEREEIKLTDKIELIKNDLDKNSGKVYLKGAGTKITYWELIKEMILSSDNTSKNALKRQLSDSEINAIFTHVGISNPYILQNGQVVTPRGYARILKSLYYSTYLSSDLSEKALDLMTDTEIESLISAGIPYQIQIAHKFSERPDTLGDCGIIYHPTNPYFLCVMVKDIELNQARQLITNLSKLTYEFVQSK